MSQDIETRCLHLPEEEEQRELMASHGALSIPIYQTATFAHVTDDGYDYSRESNPTRAHLEKIVAGLENGCDCVATSSGMAAIALVMELFTPGDIVLSDSDLYGGSIRFFQTVTEKYGVKVVNRPLYRDYTVESGTAAVYLETPTNPMMHVTDMARIAESAHSAGALLIVDNTFLSPYFQNPLDFGADIVIHSGTKFLAGHHDVLAGFVVTRRPELAGKLRRLSVTTGAVLSPQDCWLVTRGIKTLALRMDRAQENAIAVANFLLERPEVEKVLYPGLPDAEGYAIMEKQARGFGAVLTVELKSAALARGILQHTHLIKFAESLGGTESLGTYPITQTHADVPVSIREANGLNDRIVRFSLGIESERDLIADLKRTFDEAEE